MSKWDIILCRLISTGFIIYGVVYYSRDIPAMCSILSLAMVLGLWARTEELTLKYEENKK
jgi:hypothetical protein